MTVTDVNSEPRRRYFVAIVTSDYDNPPWRSMAPDATATLIRSEVEQMIGWLCSDVLRERAFDHTYPALASNPSEIEIRSALQEPAADWNHDAAIFIYVTGHGDVDGELKHRTILKTSRVDALDSTALETAELVRWLRNTGLEHVIILLDMCRAAETERGIAGLRLSEKWVILAASRDDAEVGALSGAVSNFLAELADPTVGPMYGASDRYLTLSAFRHGVQAKLGNVQIMRLLTDNEGTIGQHICLPNPHYKRPSNVDILPQRSELALPRSDLAVHWEPRSRGVASAEEAGWLFTGRSALIRDLISAANGPPGATVVTGVAGCGKSAALARLVTLSDSRFRSDHRDDLGDIPTDLLPPAGLIDAAVVATGRTSQDVFARLCRVFGAAPDTNLSLEAFHDAWRTWAIMQEKPITVVIDAIEEASDPHRFVDDVLRPLIGNPQEHLPVRLLVGLRSPGGVGNQDSYLNVFGRPLADTAEEQLGATRIRVDEAPWWNEHDVGSYVREILMHTSTSPYAFDEIGRERAHEIAIRLGRTAGRSFLVARIAASSLASRAEMLVPDDQWTLAVADGVRGVFREDLHTSLADPSERLRAVHLLRAVAFAYGRGLPWFQIWPTVANAIAAGPTYGDRDIAWLLQSRFGGYLVIDHENGLPVYRLFHYSLRQTLRTEWQDLL